MKYECRQGCVVDVGMSKPHPGYCKPHREPFVYTKALKPHRASNGGGFAASDAQRAKVKGKASIISGEGPCDPVHVWDRRLGGCDDPLCVFPATRAEHEAYERHELDILPALVAGGYFAELAHVIEAHHVSPSVLTERLTGAKYELRELGGS